MGKILQLHCFNIDLDCVEEIGRGTYGVVHKALWRGTVVAAKVLCTPTTAHEEDIIKEIESFRYAAWIPASSV